MCVRVCACVFGKLNAMEVLGYAIHLEPFTENIIIILSMEHIHQHTIHI